MLVARQGVAASQQTNQVGLVQRRAGYMPPPAAMRPCSSASEAATVATTAAPVCACCSAFALLLAAEPALPDPSPWKMPRWLMLTPAGRIRRILLNSYWMRRAVSRAVLDVKCCTKHARQVTLSARELSAAVWVRIIANRVQGVE